MSETDRTEDKPAKWRPWRPVRRLDAPPGYPWNDEEVLYEKNDSWLSGFAVGLLLGAALTFVALAFAVGVICA